MTLLHPWALLAGLAVGLPLVIHWLTRPRPVRLPLSTVRFVLEAVHQRRARHRLRDIILLILRCAAVALLAAAFARPFAGARPLVSPDPSAAAVRVVLVDQSQSMAAAWHGIAAFERARPTAARYLSWGPETKGDLILAGARPRAVADHVTSNVSSLREALAAAQPLPQRLDASAAVSRAAELLAAGPPGVARELVIVSDFQRSNWASVDFSPLPKETRIQLESAAPAQVPANLAVLAVRPQGRAQRGRELRVDVEVGNYSPAARDVRVDLSLGTLRTRLHGPCPAGVRTVLSAALLPNDAGWQAGEARLVDVEDALAADNVRPFVLEVRAAPAFSLVTRESAKPQPTSSHFLERALAPSPAASEARQKTQRVKCVEPAALDREALSADLVVLDHPGKLPQQAVALLATAMRRGRPVLYVAAEPVDATNLKLLAESAGSDLKMPAEFLPPPQGASRRDLFLAEVRSADAPFAAFGETLPAAIGPLRFSGGLASRPLPGALAEDVLASYSDRSACLVSTACGAGSLTVFNADLSQSNVVGSPVFVPLLAELVDRVLGQRQRQESVSSGEPLAAYLPPEAGAAEGLKLTGPPGAGEDVGSIAADGNFVVWHWNAAGPPGVYVVKRDAATVFAVASALPAQESELAPAEPAVLKERLAGQRSVSFQSSDEEAEPTDRLWAWVLVACTACMLAEVARSARFAHRKEHDRGTR